MIDTTALRKAAEMASPGAWECFDGVVTSKKGLRVAVSGGPAAYRRANMNFIAMANPPAIVALLDRLATLERVRDAARACRDIVQEAVDADLGAEDWDAVLDSLDVLDAALAAETADEV
jgi:hypothetical protein